MSKREPELDEVVLTGSKIKPGAYDPNERISPIGGGWMGDEPDEPIFNRGGGQGISDEVKERLKDKPKARTGKRSLIKHADTGLLELDEENHSMRKQLFGVGTKVGILEVLDVVRSDPGNNLYRRPRYKCKCACGDVSIYKYEQLWQGVTACRKCRNVKREISIAVDLSKMGTQEGRLLIGEWEIGKGWLCMCAGCGTEEYVRWTQWLERAGRRPCKTCAADSVESRPLRAYKLRIAHPDQPSNCLRIEVLGRDVKDAYERAFKVLIPYVDK